MAEVAVGTLVIALLLVTAVLTLRVTEKGTIAGKKQQDALDLAKGKSEELKSYMSSQNWNNMQVDVRFPPTQTPVVNSYQSYSPQTVRMGKNTYILDPEIRYVYSSSTSQLQPVYTPGNSQTPETGDMVRIRVDAYYGPTNEFVPLPTAEVQNNMANRVVYTNILSNRYIQADTVSTISGHVFQNCDPASSIPGALVGVYTAAATQQIMTSITDTNGFFQFQKVPAGSYYVLLASAPGFDPTNPTSCNMTQPVTISASQAVTDIWVGAKPIKKWNYYGVVGAATPLVAPPSTPTPVSAAVTSFIPAANAIVFVNDGNSLPVTANGSGAYTITGVRATPVAGHLYDVIEGDTTTSPVSFGQNFNVGVTAGGYYISGGQTYIGPITIFVTNPVTNTGAVTFIALDFDSNQSINSYYYPVTLKVVDGSVSAPQITLSSPVSMAALNVRQPNVDNVSVSIANNNPPAYQTYNQGIQIDSSVTAPITLYNYPVGSMAGTVAGMGASFDYTQFEVVAQDSNNQFLYQIPVSYNGVATYGTFNYSGFRTPNNGTYLGDPIYTFSINSGGNFSSSQAVTDVKWGKAATLTSPLLVSALNVYMAVTVTQKGSPYAYGSWVSAQQWAGGTAPGALPVSQGNGAVVNNYFSTITKGDGTSLFQVQLSNGIPTTYTVTAQIVDPTSYAVTQKAQTITMPVTASYSYPMGVSFGF